jgi:glycosyltransferase involved in cell wall biosynthesis
MLPEDNRTEISIVVPTRNRKDHVITLLKSIALQEFPPKEILIVDSSDDCSYHAEITSAFSTMPLKFLISKPSVCVQRNVGIKAALYDWVLLLDDDIEIENNYLKSLSEYIQKNPACGAVAGRLLQKEGAVWVDQYPPDSVSGLIFKFLFQLPVWGDVIHSEKFQQNFFLRTTIMNFYKKRGNTFTLAGWPLITNWSDDFMITKFYSLGANLIKRDWLMKGPYDEILDKSGIGDNYGVAMNFPQHQSIHVLKNTHAYHHRSSVERIEKSLSYYRRVLALNYFVKRNKNFGPFTTFFFLWSLAGNMLGFLHKRNYEFLKATWRAWWLILLGRNPYWIGYKSGEKNVEPIF